jgi:hypothetical protein
LKANSNWKIVQTNEKPINYLATPTPPPFFHEPIFLLPLVSPVLFCC